MDMLEPTELERAEAMLRRRHRVQVTALRNERPGGRLERLLWRIAKWAPYGGMTVPLTGKELYLMRIYLTGHGQRLHIPGVLRKPGDDDVGKGMRPYLHFINRSDEDKEPHNHPWRTSFSLILVGGYTDFRWNDKTKKFDERVFLPGSINLLRREDYHRVELLEPERGCWTLFWSVDRLQPSNGADWDFLFVETGQKMPWGEYVRRKQPTREGGVEA